MDCKLCSRKLRSDNKSGQCHPKLYAKGLCAAKAKCAVCNKVLSRKNKGDTCREHRTQSSHYKAYQLEFRTVNSIAISQYKKEYRSENRESINAYFTERLKTDIQFKLGSSLRKRLNRAIKGNAKAGSVIDELGCSTEFLKDYLESKFEPGMTWENWSINGWHIDHIYPLSKADLTNAAEFKKVCHYTNLQPMWAIPNIRKGNRI